MITEFVCDSNSLSQVDTNSSVSCSIDKDMVRESSSKMKDVEAAGASVVVSGMVKAAVERGIDRITDLKNQIIVGVVPAE